MRYIFAKIKNDKHLLIILFIFALAKLNCMLRFCWLLFLLGMMTFVSELGAQNAKRRSYEGPGNWFFGVNIGTSLAMNENVSSENFFHTEIPTGFVQLGRTLTPRWSMRATGMISTQFGHPSRVAQQYKPQMFTDYRFFAAVTTMDVMLNLSNCFRKYDTRNWFDLYLVLGGGGLFRFNMDEKVRYWYTDIYPVEANNFWFWAAKTGVEGAWHVSRSWDLVAELDVYATDNAYNGVSGSPTFWDAFLTMHVGMTYYFGNSKHRNRFANPRIVHKFWTELNE